MKPLPRLFWLFTVLVGLPLALVLAWVWRDLIRELVVIPLAYLFWMIGRSFESLPQPLLWGALVFGTCLAGFRLLAGGVAISPPAGEFSGSGGRVADWMRWISLTRRGAYSKDGLARHIGETAVAVLAYQRKCTQSEVRYLLRADALHLPPPMNAYLRAALGRESLRHDAAVFSLLPFRVHRPQPEIVAEVEAILDYLENALHAGDVTLSSPEDS